MQRSIVTICNSGYATLLEPWIQAIRKLTNLPIFVLCLNGYTPSQRSEGGLNFIRVNPSGNPFPIDLPDHACAEKMRIFEHLPAEVGQILFLDLDLLVLRAFWDDDNFFDKSNRQIIACPDLFVGYKEKMEDEFKPYDPSFRMKFNSDGSYHYFNTGVFFASRQAHQVLFRQFLAVWEDYVARLSTYPSIFDQNMFNYCFIKYGLDVCSMPVLNNCLRQYEVQTIVDGQILLNGQAVNVYHFNGGDCLKKLERWREMTRRLEESRGSAQSQRGSDGAAA